MKKEKSKIPDDENEKINRIRIQLLLPIFGIIIIIIFHSQIEYLLKITKMSFPSLYQLFVFFLILIYVVIKICAKILSNMFVTRK